MLGRGRECSRRLIASNLQSTIRDLQRRKARGRRGLALIEGVRLVEEALAAGVAFTGALVAPDLARTARGTALVAELEGHAVGVEEVGARVLAQLADTETPQGIIAVIEPRRWTASDFALAPGAVALVIDGVQDPGNVGTLIRTAHALGAAGTVVLRGTADPTSPKALRAAMGATFRHPVVTLDDGGFIAWARKHDVTLWAAAADGIPLAGQGGQEAGRVVSPAVDLPPLWSPDRVAGQGAGGLMAGAARPMSLVRSADIGAVPHHRGGRSRPVDRRHAGLRTDGPFPRGRCTGHDSPRYRPHRCAPLPHSRRDQIGPARYRARSVPDGGCAGLYRRRAGRGLGVCSAVRRRSGGGLGLQGRSDGGRRHQDDGDGGGVRRLEGRAADRIRGRVVRQPRVRPVAHPGGTEAPRAVRGISCHGSRGGLRFRSRDLRLVPAIPGSRLT